MKKQQATYTSPLDALIAVSKRLSLYENQQGIDSETFIDRYRKGQMCDDAATVEWANDYQHYLALYQEVEATFCASRRGKIENEPFIGMWRDREDMQRSSEWVRDLRQKDWI